MNKYQKYMFYLFGMNLLMDILTTSSRYYTIMFFWSFTYSIIVANRVLCLNKIYRQEKYFNFLIGILYLMSWFVEVSSEATILISFFVTTVSIFINMVTSLKEARRMYEKLDKLEKKLFNIHEQQ